MRYTVLIRFPLCVFCKIGSILILPTNDQDGFHSFFAHREKQRMFDKKKGYIPLVLTPLSKVTGFVGKRGKL